MKHGYPNDRWTLVLVMQLIDRRFGVSYSIVNVRRLLNSMGIRWQLLGPLRKRR
ncbi:helix-turn-helix domain-containing protein [Cupriavidus basilensis]|uniref:helix-turn-helix domain-containing protein n=1 Tax=Cupriavidus basilensis TaxID=68895 RepID=UPI003D32B2DC